MMLAVGRRKNRQNEKRKIVLVLHMWQKKTRGGLWDLHFLFTSSFEINLTFSP